MYVKQFPVNLNSVSTGTALAAHDQELTAIYAEHQSIATDFAGTTPPQIPVTNCRWLDTSATPPVLKRYNGSAWATEYIDHAVNADSATNATDAEKVGGNLPSNIYLKDSDQPSFRNKIINGNFAINQDEVSGTVVLTAGQYGHDMWKAGASGCTYTFTTVNNVTTITISAGSLIQVIEGINLQSGTHVVSWQGTAQGKVDGAYANSGFTFTATGGTNASVEFGIGTLSNVQVEEGSVATSFEQRPLPLELMLCQRYYRKFISIVIRANGLSSEAIFQDYFFEIPMRAVPTCTLSNELYINCSDLSNNTITAQWFRPQVFITVSGNGYCVFSATFDARL